MGSVLAPACRVWLRSQVSHVEDIRVEIAGGSRQILSGTIPRVAVVAVGAIYQGLSLGSIDLVAENIRINLPQVLKGQPLGLLEPIAVTAEVKFSAADLQISLATPLLSQAITDLFTQIVGAQGQISWLIDWTRVQIFPQGTGLTLSATPLIESEIEITVTAQKRRERLKDRFSAFDFKIFIS